MVSSSDDSAAEARWLLLIHQIPPKPDYLRVKIGRRLQRVGAVPVKNSVYVLPDSEQTLEDFQWIRSEIVDGGGDASICRADFVDGLTSEQIRQLFQRARRDDYNEIALAARALLDALEQQRTIEPDDGTLARARADDDLLRLRKRFATVRAIDFCDAPERRAAQNAIDALETLVRPPRLESTAASHGLQDLAEFQNRTWVTRESVFVDRIASAWLIRNFIDPGARFRFVPAQGYRAKDGELRFDMFDAEFTHAGDLCTFEILLRRFGLDTDPALMAIGEIVHDIDMKDAKYERAEAAGVERLLAGIARGAPNDAERIERGGGLFSALHASMRDAVPEPPARSSSLPATLPASLPPHR